MLSAVVLTKNEEKNIRRCLNSLKFCDEIVVIDDFSTDRTVKLAQKTPKVKKILQRNLKGDFAKQRNFGLKAAAGDWVLFADADEEVSLPLQKEIKTVIKNNKVEAYYLRRRDYFWGKELKYGEVRTVRNAGILRLVKKNSGQWMGDVHEVFHTAKKTAKLNNFLNHYPHPTIKDFLSDINNYSTIRSMELFNQGRKTNIIDIMFTPALKFIYAYFFNLGFLDGPAGFAYAFMMSFHSFLVRSKLYQYQLQI